VKRLLSGIVFTLLCALSSPSLSARIVLPPLPDALAKQSALICNGQVESITETGTDKTGSHPWDSVTHLTAKIKVLHVFKGQAPAEIEIKYNSGPGLINGPIQISLEKDKRYRFFLKSGPVAPFYISVLDGKYDDGFAVEALAPKEPDDSAYVSQTEALEIVQKWLKNQHPELFPVVEEPLLRAPGGKLLNKRVRTYPCLLIYPPNYFPCVWEFSLAEFSATGKGVSNRRLEVLSDRTVDAKDWNGTP